MHVVFSSRIAPVIQLSEEESAHAVRVLRMAVGDTLLVTEGRGKLYEASILDAHPKRCIVQLGAIRPWQKGWPFHLHLAFAPTKSLDRIEWLIEKATELGVDEITPLLSQHSERRELKLPRLEKLLISSIKQSQKALMPELHPLTPFETFIPTCTGDLYIGHCHEGDKRHLAQCLTPRKTVTLLIGPEGDFSAEEVTLALRQGGKAISLGTERLRTETAALYACAIAHTINQLSL